MDDAEVAIVVLGSTAGTAKVVVDELRAKGVKAGVLKIRVFRPFPDEQIAEALSGREGGRGPGPLRWPGGVRRPGLRRGPHRAVRLREAPDHRELRLRPRRPRHHPRAHRVASTTTCRRSPQSGKRADSNLVNYLGVRE